MRRKKSSGKGLTNMVTLTKPPKDVPFLLIKIDKNEKTVHFKKQLFPDSVAFSFSIGTIYLNNKNNYSYLNKFSVQDRYKIIKKLKLKI